MNSWTSPRVNSACSHLQRNILERKIGSSTLLFSRRRVKSQPLRKRHAPCKLRVAADSSEGPEESKALAPVKTRTAVGKMLDYYLRMEPHLFDAAIEEQLTGLQEERERKAKQAGESPPSPTDKSEMVLYRRINEAQQGEQRATLEDIMYICVLEKFVKLGVPMMPRLEEVAESQSGNFKKLTEGIHSQEALEMVKSHVRNLMGPTVMQYDSSVIKLPKLQAVQMYVTSIMFGYFLRRLDSRFQLERSAGLIGAPDEKEAAISRLERLFNQADNLDISDSPDTATPSEASTSSSSSSTTADSGYQSDASSSTIGGSSSESQPKKGSLREYVDKFSPETVQEMARVVSQEAAHLIDMQTLALFGDYRQLQEQMKKAVGSEFISLDELMKQVAKEMQAGSIDSVSLTVGNQRRMILEAVAFGTFLRDVEGNIDSSYSLLTATAPGGGGADGQPPGLTGAL